MEYSVDKYRTLTKQDITSSGIQSLRSSFAVQAHFRHERAWFYWCILVPSWAILGHLRVSWSHRGGLRCQHQHHAAPCRQVVERSRSSVVSVEAPLQGHASEPARDACCLHRACASNRPRLTAGTNPFSCCGSSCHLGDGAWPCWLLRIPASACCTRASAYCSRSCIAQRSVMPGACAQARLRMSMRARHKLTSSLGLQLLLPQLFCQWRHGCQMGMRTRWSQRTSWSQDQVAQKGRWSFFS